MVDGNSKPILDEAVQELENLKKQLLPEEERNSNSNNQNRQVRSYSSSNFGKSIIPQPLPETRTMSEKKKERQYNVGEYLLMKQDPKSLNVEQNVIVQIIQMDRRNETFTGAIFKKPEEIQLDQRIEFMENEIIAVARAETFRFSHIIRHCLVMQPKVNRPNPLPKNSYFMVRYYYDEKTHQITDLSMAYKGIEKTLSQQKAPPQAQLPTNKNTAQVMHHSKDKNVTTYSLTKRDKVQIKNGNKGNSENILLDKKVLTHKEYKNCLQPLRNLIDPTTNASLTWFETPPLNPISKKPKLSSTYLKYRLEQKTSK